MCPSCGEPAIRTGKEILCESCDVVFVVRRRGGTHIRRLGALTRLDERISKLESKTVAVEETKPNYLLYAVLAALAALAFFYREGR